MSEAYTELRATDLDRTLLDTGRAFEVLVIASNEVAGVDKDLLLSSKAETEASGGSFDVFGYLAAQGIVGGAMEELYAGFVELGQEADLLYDDALPYLRNVDQAGHGSMIITYGAIAWQGAKIAAAGLSERACLITSRKHKGDLIDSWRQPNGSYMACTGSGELILAPTVKLADDKASSFRGLPSDCSGYWLIRPGTGLLPSQAGEVPANVEVCTSLLEIPIVSAR